MKQEKFCLPLQKMSFKADLKIRKKLHNLRKKTGFSPWGFLKTPQYWTSLVFLLMIGVLFTKFLPGTNQLHPIKDELSFRNYSAPVEEITEINMADSKISRDFEQSSKNFTLENSTPLMKVNPFSLEDNVIDFVFYGWLSKQEKKYSWEEEEKLKKELKEFLASNTHFRINEVKQRLEELLNAKK